MLYTSHSITSAASVNDGALCPPLQIADEFRDEPVFYLPHNIDFRGRCYPMHAHLNHLGHDVNRGILQFAQARPLGERGLYWLHLQANHPSYPSARFHSKICDRELSTNMDSLF